MPLNNITPTGGNVVPLRRSSPAHQLERAVIDAEYNFAAVARGMRELRHADAIDADYAVRFGDLLTDLELATSLLVAARAKAVAS